jgi:hypothetical protein
VGGRISWRQVSLAVFWSMAETEQYFDSLSSIERAVQPIEDFESNPHGGRLGRALAGTNDLQSLKFLPLFLENTDYIGGRACAQRHQDKLHRAGSCVGSAVGIDGNGMAGRTDGQKFLLANPFYRCCLHFVPPMRLLFIHKVKDSKSELKMELRSGKVLRLAVHFLLEAKGVLKQRKPRVGILPDVEKPIKLL